MYMYASVNRLTLLQALAVHQVPRLPRKSHRQSGGDQAMPGRTSDPLQCTGTPQGDPSSPPSPTPATQKLPAERQRPRDARAYIRPLAVHQVPRLPGRTSDALQCTKSHACHARATGRAAESKGRHTVHLTTCVSDVM